MQLKTICKLIGMLLMIFSLSMLTPLIVEAIYKEGHWQPYFLSFTLTFGTGLLLWLPARHCRYELKTRDGFLIVS